MIGLALDDVAALLGARMVTTAPTAAALWIDAVSTDTRVMSSGAGLFVALQTPSADGHDHAASASRAGCVAVLVARELPSCDLPQLVVEDTWRALDRLARAVVDRVGCRVVAITGSYGKTTTKDLAAAALAGGASVAAARASFNNELGVPLTMLSVTQDTQVLVAEAGARNAGDLSHMAALLRPDIAVVTAVGPVHLETFGDLDGVAAEKGRLVAGLSPEGTAVLNVDDPRVRAMPTPARRTLRVSAEGRADADVRARDVELDAVGRVRAMAETPWGDVRLEVPLPGRHHLANALLALAVAGASGISVEVAARGIAGAATSPSRAVLHAVGGVTVLDDAYNASAPTVIGALATLSSLPCTGRRWAVLGTMAELGATSHEQHLDVGRIAALHVDELVVVGEGAGALASGAQAAGLAPENLHRCADHAEASELLRRSVRRGDVVLLKASRVVGLDRSAAALLASLEGGDAA
jgi:UDP-N-acetylmuramoyl-tripeptide--D-alanyl-D-alanine ligase